MKFIISIILIALLSYALGLVFPWWSIAFAALIVGIFIPQKPFMTFLSGFIALFLLWGIMSWAISSANHYILSHRISLLILKNDSPVLLVLITAFLGAIVGGLAALTGSYLHKKN